MIGTIFKCNSSFVNPRPGDLLALLELCKSIRDYEITRSLNLGYTVHSGDRCGGTRILSGSVACLKLIRFSSRLSNPLFTSLAIGLVASTRDDWQSLIERMAKESSRIPSISFDWLPVRRLLTTFDLNSCRLSKSKRRYVPKLKRLEKNTTNSFNSERIKVNRNPFENWRQI